MTAREAIENVRKIINTAEESDLVNAITRLEKKVAEAADNTSFAFNIDAPLIAEGFDDMYTAYLKREAYLLCEDWDCFSSYNAIFKERWEDYAAYIRRRISESNKAFSDWRW